ncbi:putative aarF domain-containing protein kinase [Apostasia shenzhenica]|uniref:Putative aarF domain-containing protein kinase n=1 Tax=Apostasia shenzhenica TaxID=1088818 RepID=A0A2I0BFM7_9ASPA|nr:putative aarF domain-containing protein kinase [Apostasia shenzhenica]
MLLLFPPHLSLFFGKSVANRRPASATGPPDQPLVLEAPGVHRRLWAAPAAASVSGDVDSFTKYSGYLFKDGVSSEAEFLNDYDLKAIAAIYRRKPLLVLRRFVQIGTTFGRWFAQRYSDGLLDRSDEMFKMKGSNLILGRLSRRVNVRWRLREDRE